MKILVTGAAGYLGSVLCPRFAEAGYEVIAVDLESPPRIFLEQPGIEYHSGDVLDESLMRPLIQRADVIVPLAALVGTPLCAREPEQAWAVNLGGIRLIQKMRASGQSVIFPMTNNGYTPAPGQAYATEETPMQALSVYTQSKQQAEKELFATANIISLRLSSVFGVSPKMRADLLIHHFVLLALQEGKIELYEEGFKRNFVHIQDVAGAFLYAIQNGKVMQGRAYNVAQESCNVSKQELAIKIKEKIPSCKILCQTKTADPDQRDFFISTERLKATGFQAQYSLEQGIEELMEYYTKQQQHILSS